MIHIIHGDCTAELPKLTERFHACVTDPPYHLTSIVKRFGAENAAPAKKGATGVYARSSRGFMGKTWDGGDVAFRPETWRAVFDVLLPGAHLLAFGGTRTFHRLVCAIEDAGFEVRDTIGWVFGSGFPKSLDVSRAIDKAAGAEREVVGIAGKSGAARACMAGDFAGGEYMKTAPATPEAQQWSGWGTALKPAMELICVARKPLSEGSVAANVLRHGCGALNVDASRIAGAKPDTTRGAGGQNGAYHPLNAQGRIVDDGLGRWPANLIHDGSEEVLAAFPDSDHARGNMTPTKRQSSNGVWGAHGATFGVGPDGPVNPGDTGSAARFFYSAKADASDRAGSRHPTVKPTDLMRYLVRLVTPPGGTVLDPFCGTGSTLLAADQLGFNAVGIEQDATYASDARRKIERDAGMFAEVAV